MIKFNKDAPSARIHPPFGTGDRKACWMQNYEYFDSQFDHIPGMSRQGVDPETITRERMSQNGGVEPIDMSKYVAVPDDFDFLGWLNGEVKEKWFVVKGAMLAHYGRDVTSKDDAVTFLLDEGGFVEVQPGRFAVRTEGAAPAGMG